MGKNDKRELEVARKKLATELDSFLTVSKGLFEPLRGLTDEQVTALVALAYTLRIALLAGRPV